MTDQKEVLKDADEIQPAEVISSQSGCCGSSQEIAVIKSGEIRDQVQDFYAARALNSSACCGDEQASVNTLYDVELIDDLPEDVAGFTLGCGDPITLAELQPGDTVLDLGSGGGLDCFLAAKIVGPEGRVIGLDMTPEMLARARSTAERLGFEQVEFREGYLEEMPVSDGSVDVIVSNCVINLSPDKPKVFAEMYRVLRPGGRIAVSDIVTNGELPEVVRENMVAWGACIAGALDQQDYSEGLQAAGFVNVEVSPKGDAGDFLEELLKNKIFSASITASKP
jgi:ubiquinone/menaquinone biosynthesis C-methylase UbiE